MRPQDTDLKYLYEQSMYTGSSKYEVGYLRALVSMMHHHINVEQLSEGEQQ